MLATLHKWAAALGQRIDIVLDAAKNSGWPHSLLAEVVSYADFQKHGSMKEAKTHGVYRLESKTYVVQDGDIMHILAST